MKHTVADCAAERTLRVISGRWKIFILLRLLGKTRRFAELRKAINANTRKDEDITAKILAQELKQMEADGLVRREVFAEVPPKVEYSLTPHGCSLQPVLTAMHLWGLSQPDATDEEENA